MIGATSKPADFAQGARGISLAALRNVLKVTYGIVPIVAGIDKFTNLLASWESYLNPLVLRIVPVSAHLFMGTVGVIEIAAGILVLRFPRLGASIVSAWLVAVALSLITSGNHLDVAVRDLVMAVGAFTLARLTAEAGSQE